MLPSIHVETELIGTLAELPLVVNIDLENGITLDPLQSMSKDLSHLGIGICKN
jgi:hypothetical protein